MDNSDLGSRSFLSHPRSVFPGSAAWESSDLRSVLSVISDLGHFSREKSDLGPKVTSFQSNVTFFQGHLLPKILTLPGTILTLPRDDSDLARAEIDLGLEKSDLGLARDGKFRPWGKVRICQGQGQVRRSRSTSLPPL